VPSTIVVTGYTKVYPASGRNHCHGVGESTNERPAARYRGIRMARFSAVFSYQPQTIRDPCRARQREMRCPWAETHRLRQDRYGDEDVMVSDAPRLRGLTAQGILEALDQVRAIEWLAQKA
jgi:hypothetical protein